MNNRVQLRSYIKPMKFNPRKLIAISMILIVPAIFPVAAYAQSTAPASGTDSQITNLPNDIQNQEAQQQAQQQAATTQTTTTSTTSLTQSQEFLVGVGVGVVLGIIVGGVIVWFTKK